MGGLSTRPCPARIETASAPAKSVMPYRIIGHSFQFDWKYTPKREASAPLHVLGALLAFQAHLIHQLGIQHDLQGDGHAPWLGVRFRVLDGGFYLQGSEIRAPEPLHHFRAAGQR